MPATALEAACDLLAREGRAWAKCGDTKAAIRYSDLLTADGQINQVAVRRLARNRARADRDIDICLAVGWTGDRAPFGMRLGDMRAWRHETALRYGTPEAFAAANARYRKTYARALDGVRGTAKAMRDAFAAQQARDVFDRIADDFTTLVNVNIAASRALARAQAAE